MKYVLFIFQKSTTDGKQLSFMKLDEMPPTLPLEQPDYDDIKVKK